MDLSPETIDRLVGAFKTLDLTGSILAAVLVAWLLPRVIREFATLRPSIRNGYTNSVSCTMLQKHLEENHSLLTEIRDYSRDTARAIERLQR